MSAWYETEHIASLVADVMMGRRDANVLPSGTMLIESNTSPFVSVTVRKRDSG